MMKHETKSKPMPIMNPKTTLETSGTSSLKRGLWRNRSASEAPDGIRSPITKAFDFLPWGRSKKTNDKIQIKQLQQELKQQQKLFQVSASGQSGTTNSNTNTKVGDKDANIHYHRNIFRSGGGLIRDILGGDKLNKEKAHNNQQDLVLRKSNQRQKPNQVVTRNKSFDIHELLNSMKNELSGDRKKDGTKHFMDDTFIENIMRAKEAYCQENNSFPNDDKPDDYKFDEITNKDKEIGEQSIEQKMSHEGSDEQLYYTPTGNSSTTTPARHILFNDEDVIYLIKKELPVKRELSKTKRRISTNHLSTSEREQQQHQQQKINHQQRDRESERSRDRERERSRDRERERSRDRHERSESVLRARLKFKKLSPDPTPITERRSTLAQISNINQHHNYNNQNGIDYGQSNVRSYQSSRSMVDNYATDCDDGKRHNFQRQNTSPAQINDGNGNIDGSNYGSPGNRRRHHQLFQRGEQRAQLQRRKSLTDYDNVQLPNCSSSSSMTSGGGGGATVAASVNGSAGQNEPINEKPRKKLSFREPVADKAHIRYRSSPLQRPNCISPDEKGMHKDSKASDAAADSGTFKELSNRLTIQDDNANKVSCDNLSVCTSSTNSSSSTSSGGSSCKAVIPLPPDNCNYSAQISNKAIDAKGCYYIDNANLTMDFESQAMRIVRTVGQAFEVCHKFNLHKNSLDHNDERSDVSSELLDIERISEQQLSEDELDKKEPFHPVTDIKPPQRPNHLELVPHTSTNMRKSPSLMPADEDKSPTTPSSPSHEISKLKDQLEQQAIQTRQALAQLMLVREQLISETNARIEAQARTQQLLQQNRELLEHLASLGAYNEQQAAGLTSANIGMAPQLQMLLQAAGNNNNLAAINQQINSLGSINQQLTSLSHQLSGLNQQSQNIQNFQNLNATQHQQQQQQQQQQQTSVPVTIAQQQLTPSSTSAPLQPTALHLNIPTTANSTNANNNNNNNNNSACGNSSSFPTINQLQNISNQLQQLNAQATHSHQQDTLSKDLFQVNQELLNRLQALNLGANNSNATPLTPYTATLTNTQQTPSPRNSFFFVNPMSCSPVNNNNAVGNFSFLSSPSTLSGQLTPSPLSTLTRSSYTHSPQLQQRHTSQIQQHQHDIDALRLSSIDQNLNNLIDEHLMKPLAGSIVSSATSNGNISGRSPSVTCDSSRSSSTLDSTTPSSPHIRSGNSEQRFNTVTLKVTDEAGNVTNQRKLSATPSFIQRSTSEKVPNRSQIMSQVQRTAWARHTTK